ncbi:CDP-glycerol glycerophosphotransferase family protein [Aquibacillus koreensis]|uniref:CDP-glycerol glycerophosphotransferase family protein n=1 Tax=Aquibacillus koreensis TaxID=279446 RepID=A0A9X4AIU9_9BACI|nr:CDP-glycerol glycerophosphotransferase family protein [Aquibacillus koreensis]MCT2535127.1 CDP-glycerol glycerophosphotransferase family protein [Aquibacillus koreensis]MDC3419770.1 CDP-glycerol glycerophosphotransferase family protein [Aquibacillus koreensis]
MVRELVISSYLFIFRIFFNLFKLFPQKEKTTFVASFGDNIDYVIHELKQLNDDEIVILKKTSCRVDFSTDESQKVLDFETTNLIHFVQSIYHIATSKVVFIDNYFGFLSVTDFKPNVVCVQLWHAAGAIKQFGLLDPSIVNRSERARQRFIDVYSRFTYVVVGSEKMSSIFRSSFGVQNENILRTGIPRTDFFFNKKLVNDIKHSLHESYPIINDKKVIMYAPTYRDSQLNSANIALEIETMYQELGDDYVLFLRLHPAIKGKFDNKYPEFVYDLSDYEDINHLLLVTDLLITDYSSIPFEYSLLGKPMIFFTYDLESYTNERGFWEDFESNLPGPIARTTEEVIQQIQSNQFDMDKVKAYANEWNRYSRGNSSQNIVKAVYAEEERYEAMQ